MVWFSCLNTRKPPPRAPLLSSWLRCHTESAMGEEDEEEEEAALSKQCCGDGTVSSGRHLPQCLLYSRMTVAISPSSIVTTPLSLYRCSTFIRGFSGVCWWNSGKCVEMSWHKAISSTPVIERALEENWKIEIKAAWRSLGGVRHVSPTHTCVFTSWKQANHLVLVCAQNFFFTTPTNSNTSNTPLFHPHKLSSWSRKLR